MSKSPRRAPLSIAPAALTAFAVLVLVACGSSSSPGAKVVTTASAPPTTAAPATTTTTAAATTTTTAAPASGGASTTLAGATDPAAALGAMGLSASEAACIQGKVDLSKINPEATDPGAPFFRALIACAPDWMAKEFSKSFSDSLPSATADQLTCIGKGTIAVFAQLDDTALETVLVSDKNFSDLPADVRAKVLAGSANCGVPAADLEKAFNAT
jgi:hypothetical protein